MAEQQEEEAKTLAEEDQETGQIAGGGSKEESETNVLAQEMDSGVVDGIFKADRTDIRKAYKNR